MKKTSNIIMIILVILLTNIIIGGAVYCWQNWAGVNMQSVAIKNTNMQETNMVSPIASSKVSKQTMGSKQDKTVFNCKTIGKSWELFKSDDTTLSFCYQSSWGVPMLKETSIDISARIGTMYNISFPNLINEGRLLIDYSTLDFKKTGNRDTVAILDWDRLDFSKSSAQLAQLLPNANGAKGEKLTINGRQIFKVQRNFPMPIGSGNVEAVDYFIPKVTINNIVYNLHIFASQNNESKVDKLVGSLTFE